MYVYKKEGRTTNFTLYRYARYLKFSKHIYKYANPKARDRTLIRRK